MPNKLLPAATSRPRFTVHCRHQGDPPDDTSIDQAVWETCFDALLVVDGEGTCRRVNASAAELLGTSNEDLVGTRIEQFTPCGLRHQLGRLRHELMCRGAVHGTYEVVRPDGTGRLVQFRARRDVAPGEHLIVAREIAGYATAPRQQVAHSDAAPLTPRELEILQLAADGGSTKTIASTLVVSNGTVKTHFEHIYEKFGVGDRAAAVAEGFRLGLIE